VTTRRFLALGDSYTIGEGVEPAGRWPVQLAARLRGAGAGLAEPVIIARTGWTTDELAVGIDVAEIRGPFDLVSLLIGVNDAYRGRDAVLPLIRRAVAFADGHAGRVVMVSIPDWSGTPFADGRDRAAIAATIAEYNAVGRAAAEAARVRWADVTPASQQSRPDWLTTDGLHPSERQYAAWVDAIAPTFRTAIMEPAFP
jgi:prepilin-type processing-associated H-X9-DG protein